MMRIGELIRLYRAVEKLTVRECAEEIGVHYATVARIEHSDSGLSADSWLKIQTWLLAPTAPRRGETPG